MSPTELVMKLYIQPSLIDNIVAYVDLKYADYTLSLEHVALKYSVSLSYLSRSFKEKMGCNFSQYIWHRRMEEVIRLLVNTDAPLKEIIESVGYLDAPNFIRKFKKETGYTPGQYRKLKAAEISASQENEYSTTIACTACSRSRKISIGTILTI